MDEKDQALLNSQLAILYDPHSFSLRLPQPLENPNESQNLKSVYKIKVGRRKNEEVAVEKAEELTSPVPKKKRGRKPLVDLGLPLTCRFCHRIQRDTFALRGHERIHTGEKPYQCVYCSKGFASKQSWTCHQKICSKKNPKNKRKSLVENTISLSSRPRILIQLSVVINEGRMPKKWKKENQVNSAGPSDANAHIPVSAPADVAASKRGWRNRIKTIPSKDSIKKTSSENRKISGLKSSEIKQKPKRTEERRFKCKFCHKPQRKLSELISHERVHTGEKPYSCNLCRKHFAWKQNRDAHETRGRCRDLKKKIRLENEIKNENESSIASPKPNTVSKIENYNPISDQNIKSKPEIVDMDALSSLQFKCKFCPQVFRKQFSRDFHESRSHLFNVKLFKCQSCPRRFVSNEKLSQHQISHRIKIEAQDEIDNNLKKKTETVCKPPCQEVDVKGFPCKICAKVFTLKNNLKTHLKIHSGNQRLYSCPHCCRSFKSSYGMTYHLSGARSSACAKLHGNP